MGIEREKEGSGRCSVVARLRGKGASLKTQGQALCPEDPISAGGCLGRRRRRWRRGIVESDGTPQIRCGCLRETKSTHVSVLELLTGVARRAAGLFASDMLPQSTAEERGANQRAVRSTAVIKLCRD